MSIEKIKKLQAEKGFTIVELLIVIVIIGILAAIVIVAYTGITQQANNSKYKANATSIQKVAEARNADDNTSGSYPTSSSTFTSTYTKLPDGVTINSTESTRTKASPGTSSSLESSAKNGTYEVNYCTSGGLVIFYPVVGQTNASFIEVGTTTAGC